MLLDAAAAAAMRSSILSISSLVSHQHQNATTAATAAMAVEAATRTLAHVPIIFSFPNKYVVDDREPQFVLDLDNGGVGLLSSNFIGIGGGGRNDGGQHGGYGEGVYGITSIDPMFWLQSFFLVFLQSAFNVCVAMIVYKYIVVVRQQQRQHHHQAYLMGYGLIIPILLCVPWLGIQFLDLQNIAFILLVAGATPSLLILRCMEAMHGTLPQFAYDNRLNFILYYATTLGFQFNFDNKTHQIVSVTRKEFIYRTIKFLRLYLFSTVCYSVLLPRGCKLFPSKPIHTPFDTLHYGNLLNNLVMAALFIVCLDTGSTGLGLVASLLTGYSTTEMNDRPLIASTSPSDFWGRRWNRIFAGCLKSGVYMPARKLGCTRTISSMLTFLVSGLLHEYVLLIMATAGTSRIAGEMEMTSAGSDKHSVNANAAAAAYLPNFGNQLLFFAWSGIVLMMEGRVRKHRVILWMRDNLARPIRTCLVMMTALPVLHWFTDEYVACGLFQDVSLGFPKIMYLGKSE